MSTAELLELQARQAELYTEWRAEFGSIVDGDLSVECVRCGEMAIGDGAPIPIQCWECCLEEGGVGQAPDMSSDDPLEG